MFKFLASAALVIVLATPVHAKNVYNQFTCHGTLTNDGNNNYSIVEDGEQEDYNIMTCYLDEVSQKTLNKILSICHPGDRCIITAFGLSGSGNRHIVNKVLSTRKQAVSPDWN